MSILAGMNDQELQNAIDALEHNVQLRYHVNEALRCRLRHVSQTRIAQELDLSVAYICDWMHGRRELPPKRLRAIYERLVKGNTND